MDKSRFKKELIKMCKKSCPILLMGVGLNAYLTSMTVLDFIINLILTVSIFTTAMAVSLYCYFKMKENTI